MKPVLAAIAALVIIPIANAGEVSVSFSDDFIETLEDDYGTREGERLSKRVVKDLNQAFERAGVDPARVEVTIIDAKPNRPTFEQLGARPGLDPNRSISIGGMELTATAYDADGGVLAERNYSWFESNIRHVVGSATWTDARRASGRFARKFAADLKS